MLTEPRTPSDAPLGPGTPSPPAGAWVEFVVDAFVGPRNVVVRGMLGAVDDHPYARYVCTPGLSTMVLPVGARESYGYANGAFRALDAPPNDRAREASRALWRDALAHYEGRRGYTG